MTSEGISHLSFSPKCVRARDLYSFQRPLNRLHAIASRVHYGQKLKRKVRIMRGSELTHTSLHKFIED